MAPLPTWQDRVKDNAIQALGAVLVGIAVPLAAQFPQAAPYIAVASGGIALFLGKMYPDWKQGWFSPRP